MEDLSGIDWEDAFENGGYIENGSSYPDLWAKRAAEFRSRHADRMSEVAYGDAPREKIDLFRPEGASKGLVVFVHGGYWLKFSKDMWSHLAQGALAQGWTVALPGYTLAPENSIPGIAQQIYKRFKEGNARNPAFATFGPFVSYLEQRCLGIIAQSKL